MIIMRTRGFISEIPKELQAEMMSFGLRRIRPDKPTWVVFYPNGEREEQLEDDGRTLITSMKDLTKKVYAILDDFGSIQALRDNMGEYAPKDLNTQYVVTFLLAEEY